MTVKWLEPCELFLINNRGSFLTYLIRVWNVCEYPGNVSLPIDRTFLNIHMSH